MMVPYASAEKTRRRLLDDFKLDPSMHTLHTYPGMGHSVCPQELADVLKFLQQVLPPNDDYCVKPKDPKEMSVKELKQAIRDEGLASKAVGLMEKSEFVRLLVDHRAGKL